MNKHTPGPWILGDENNQGCSVVIGATHNLLCGLDRQDANTGIVVIERDEMLANAHLIAAAPDLLEALQRSIGALENVIKDAGGCDHSVGICMCYELRIVADGRAAIAKATQ